MIVANMKRVVFVQKDVFAKGGIMALSAVLKSAGYDCRAVVADLERDVVRAVLELQPDAVAFSITTPEYPFMKAVGTRLREQHYDKTIICGGSHPTFCPEVIHDLYLDVLCRGEGDEAMLDFLQACKNGKATESIPNLWVKKNGKVHTNAVRPLVADLDQLPFYDRSIYERYRLYGQPRSDVLFHKMIMTGRGCPKACSYCFNKLYNTLYLGMGRIMRRRSVPHVIRELKLLKQSYAPSCIRIEDDNFTLAPKNWLEEFCAAYGREIAIPFSCNSIAANLTEETVKQLKRAGCFAVRIGLESGNDHIRNQLLNKNVSEESIIDAAGLLRKYRIRLQSLNMVGNPGESLSMGLQTYALNRRIKPDFALCTLLTPFPGTDLHQTCKDLGYLEEAPDFDDVRGFVSDTTLALPDKTALVNLQKLLYVGLLLRMPEALLRFLVRLPLTPVYRLLYGIGLVWGLSRINKGSLLSLARLSLLHFYRYNRTGEIGLTLSSSPSQTGTIKSPTSGT
jgi:anaerobic magnesium-protoporphyrin IX monomethyl ester cyclase